MSRFLPRRPLAFSLRTLMVLVGVVALVSAWLAYDRGVVLERKATLAAWDRRSVADWIYAVQRPGRPTPVPLVRRLFGDRAVAVVVVIVDGQDGKSELERAQRLFPEAHVEAPMVFEPPTP